MDDVWVLESPLEEVAAEDLNFIIDEAMKFRGTGARAYLRKLWNGETWQSIKARLLTEGSVWYVWYMDGVRQHLSNMIKEARDGESVSLVPGKV